jgi:transcriptional regulator
LEIESRRLQKEIELIMYLPKHFSINEESKVRKLIEQNSFVTLLSYPKDSQVYINHLPVIYSSKSGQENILIGHMSKKNPQWMHFKENENSMIIVQGGHTYITPRWYQSGRDVPTWNYAVAHLSGKIELVESFVEQVEILKELSYFFEKSSLNPWEFELPSDLREESTLTSSIISFKFSIEKIESKFKLSQNRSVADKKGIIEGLKNRTDEMSKLVREMMIEND